MNECILGHNQILSRSSLLYNCITNINRAVCAWEGSQYLSAKSSILRSKTLLILPNQYTLTELQAVLW